MHNVLAPLDEIDGEEQTLKYVFKGLRISGMAVHAYNPNLLIRLKKGESLEFTCSRPGSTTWLDTGHKQA